MLKFNEIKVINDDTFKSFINIYKDSFPENQKLPLDIVSQRTQENTHQIFGGFLDNQVVLIAILHLLKGTDFILLIYLATDSNFRGQGIATEFMNYILNWAINNHKYLLIEVENPDFGNDKDKKIRRIKFYTKLGALELKNVNYILPPLSGNIYTEMKLLLMPKYYQNFLDGDLVKKLIQQMYQEVYSRQENDPLLDLFIHDIDNSVELISPKYSVSRNHEVQ